MFKNIKMALSVVLASGFVGVVNSNINAFYFSLLVFAVVWGLAYAFDR